MLSSYFISFARPVSRGFSCWASFSYKKIKDLFLSFILFLYICIRREDQSVI